MKTRRYAGLMVAMMASCALRDAAIDRMAKIGQPPEMSKIENPQQQADYQPVSMPMPAPKMASRQPNSLWDSSRQTFFKDQRASDIGDILTVLIEIKDKAELDNESARSRDSSENAGIDNLLGYESKLNGVLPEAVEPSSLVGFGNASNHTGSGSIDREEKIQVKLAATITQVLPNGNFVIHGTQEVRVNFENRVLAVDGIIRPQDVSTDNTINYEQIAEARISYGGKGQITDVQQPRYGQQAYDILFPF